MTKAEMAAFLPLTTSRSNLQREAVHLAALREHDAAMQRWMRHAVAGLVRRIGTLARATAELPQRQRVLAELRGLTDRELSDIGLTRGDLGQVFATTQEPRRAVAFARPDIAAGRARAA